MNYGDFFFLKSLSLNPPILNCPISFTLICDASIREEESARWPSSVEGIVPFN